MLTPPPISPLGNAPEDVYNEAGQRIASGGPDPSLSRDALCYRSGNKWFTYADVYPGPVNVHQNVPLSDYAVAWEKSEDMNIGPKIAPVMTVDHRSDIYYFIGQQGQEITRTPTDETDRRAVGALANDIQNVFDTATYTCKNRALRDFLPDDVVSNQDQILNLTQRTTDFLMTTLEYRYAARVLALISSTANLTQTASFATACGVGGKFITDATAAARYINIAFNYVKAQTTLNNFMQPCNAWVSGLDCAQAIEASPEVAAQIVYSMGQQYIERSGWNTNAVRGGLPEVIYGLETLVAPHIQNTAKKGQTNAFSALLANKLCFLHIDQPSLRTLNTAQTFRQGGINVRTYRDEGRKGMWIEAEMIQDEKITNLYGGYILTAPLS